MFASISFYSSRTLDYFGINRTIRYRNWFDGFARTIRLLSENPLSCSFLVRTTPPQEVLAIKFPLVNALDKYPNVMIQVIREVLGAQRRIGITCLGTEVYTESPKTPTPSSDYVLPRGLPGNICFGSSPHSSPQDNAQKVDHTLKRQDLGSSSKVP